MVSNKKMKCSATTTTTTTMARRPGLPTLMLAILLAVSMVSCNTSDHPPLKGYLYFGAGSYLGAFNLQTGDTTPITNLGELELDFVSAFDNDELLLSVSSSSSVRSRERILRYDPTQQRTREFLLGSNALYLPESSMLVFNSSGRILAVSRNDAEGTERLILHPDRRQLITMVPMNGSQLLVGTKQETRHIIQNIDVASGEVETLDDLSLQCSLKGALWIADQNAVLCKPPRTVDENPSYRMVSLQGQVGAKLKLPENQQFHAVTYLAEERMVVFNETWRGWIDDSAKHAVWVYHLDSGESRKLAADQSLGRSVVYRRTQY